MVKQTRDKHKHKSRQRQQSSTVVVKQTKAWHKHSRVAVLWTSRLKLSTGRCGKPAATVEEVTKVWVTQASASPSTVLLRTGLVWQSALAECSAEGDCTSTVLSRGGTEASGRHLRTSSTFPCVVRLSSAKAFPNLNCAVLESVLHLNQVALECDD